MVLLRSKVECLMNVYCDGNYNRFARELGVDPAHLYRYLKTGVGGGSKVIGGVFKFCKSNHLNFEEYIQF